MRKRSKTPSNWNVWNPLGSKSINYASIYDKRREFQRLIRKMKIEGSKICETSSCCIFDYTIDCSSKIQEKIDVIFFDESEHFNYLLLQLVIDEKLTMRKSNSLMVFLNKTKNCKIFELFNSSLYISCKDGLKWPAFYDSLGFFMQKPSETVIGITFYTNFVYKSMIDCELTFLLVYSSKENLSKLAVQGKTFHSTVDPKSNKISSTEDLDGMKSLHMKLPLKRRNVQEFSKCKRNVIKDGCNCKGNKWQYLKPILKCSHKDYKHILEAKGIFMKSKPDPFTSISNVTQNTLVKSSSDAIKIPEVDLENGASLKRKLSDEYMEKDMLCAKEKSKSPKLSDEYRVEQTEHKMDKTINISSCGFKHDLNKAMDSVQRSSSAVLLEKNTIKISKTGEIPSKGKLSIGYTEKTSDLPFTKENHQPQFINTKLVCGKNELRSDEAAGKSSFINLKSSFSSVYNIHVNKEEASKPLNNQSGIPTFQTASGKSLSISEKARRIAEKIYTEVCSQATDSDKQEEMKNVPTVNSGNELNDDELDIFFQDVCNEAVNQCSSTQGNITTQSQQAKSRKSLGGRRSLKPYSHKA